MGIFSSKPAGAPLPPQDLVEYEDTCDECPVHVRCDMGLKAVFPTQLFPVCIRLDLPIFIRDPEQGIVSSADLSRLDMIKGVVEGRIDGFYAGQGIICAKSIAFMMFYVSERCAKSAVQMLANTLTGTFTGTSMNRVNDPDGRCYSELLYPHGFQLNTVENTKLLSQLNSYGDSGREPRQVRFNLVFTGQEMTSRFAAEAAKLGYSYIGILPQPFEGMVLPQFKLTIAYDMPFDPALLEIKIRELSALAERFSGEYRSVETDVIKERRKKQ
jgi:hypothetical protein